MGYLESLRNRPVRTELTFDKSEYRQRLTKLQQELRARSVDVLLVHSVPNICYLCGYETPGTALFACLAVPSHDDPILQVADHEVSCAVLSGCVEDIRSYRWYEPDTVPVQTASIVAEQLAGKGHPTIAMERTVAGMSIGNYEILRQHFPAASFVDGSEMVPNLRRIKSNAEIALLRQSGYITKVGIDAALDAVKPGVTDNHVAAEGYYAMLVAGSEYVSTQPFVAIGSLASLVHSTFKRRRISTGDTVLLEFASSYGRYSAPMMRSAVVGSPSSSVQKLVDAVQDTLGLLLENIRASRTAHEIACVAAKGFAAVHEEIYFQGAYGYQVGLSLPPGWGEGSTPYIAQGVHEELKAGMVFHLPIAARVPGVCGVALSETVLVTDATCEILTSPVRNVRVVAT